MIVAGEVIPATGHTPGEPADVVAPTCTEDGFTGTVTCAVCGEELDEGAVTPATGHIFDEPEDAVPVSCLWIGHTGTRVCQVCGQTFEDELLPMAEHDFVNHECTICGWREPGLYIDGELAMTWDEMIANDFFILGADGTRVQGVLGECEMGTLVISEDVEYLGTLRNNTISELWLPRTLTGLVDPFLGNESVTRLRLFFPKERFSDRQYNRNRGLKEIVLMDGTVTEFVKPK